MSESSTASPFLDWLSFILDLVIEEIACFDGQRNVEIREENNVRHAMIIIGCSIISAIIGAKIVEVLAQIWEIANTVERNTVGNVSEFP